MNDKMKIIYCTKFKLLQIVAQKQHFCGKFQSYSLNG